MEHSPFAGACITNRRAAGEGSGGVPVTGSASGDVLARANLYLTDNEGTLLALVARAEPITAYQIGKIYEQSPVSNFNTSKGKIYPLIRRLHAAHLLRPRKIKSDKRGTEQFETTKQGRNALRQWIKEVRPTHLLPEDQLRTKVQSFDLLTREERLEWIAEVKTELLRKLEEVEQFGEQVSVPYHDLVHENAVRTIRSRMDWLDLVLQRVVKDKS